MTERAAGASQPGAPTPERINQLSWGYAPSAALATAIELSLFTHVAQGKNTLADLEKATGASRRGLQMLVNTMVALQFLRRESTGDRERFGLTPESETFLVEGKPSYMGRFARWSAQNLMRDWSSLTECVRTGKPVRPVDNPEEGAALWDELVDMLFPMAYPSAVRLGEELKHLYPDGPLRLLDVAAGSGVWGIAPAKVNPNARVVAFDLPGTLPHTRRWAEQFGVADRFEFRAGDIRKDDLGSAEFDAVILGNICHSEGAEHTRRLFAKVARTLKPGGTLAIADMLPNEDRSGPLFPLLFALNMLVHTTEGDTFTFAEYDQWLQAAGFVDARLLEIPGPSPLVLATRAG